ncbi:hypothetical protein LIL_10291 [Leptospira interrogans serovar Linhai str. 56609]|nr:hypothetical protein LIL_10291 [Leptospira interrogans serovar Linhai str. 56609]
MDRRSGLKKAHFSSVPTRMSLFTCKKYVFLIEKNFPNLIASTPPKDRENSATLSYGSRWKTQQRFPMGRVGKLNTTLFMNRVVGWELSFTEDFVVIPTDLY